MSKKNEEENGLLTAESLDSGGIFCLHDEDIHTRVATIRHLMQGTHNGRENFSYKWRMHQLSCLENMVQDHYEEMLDVLFHDLGKCRAEAAVYELEVLRHEVLYLKRNLKRFLQPQDLPSPAFLLPAFTQITPMPKKGPAVLVIGPSNYPISISLMAVAGSLAAGNPTVLKPSELCPKSSQLLAKLVPEYFASNAFQVVQGAVPETTALLDYDWGLIHFTGSERVGKIVASAAAKTLTPTILELGGKNPCFVDETCPRDIRQVANRIVWGRMINCGQNCISPDYLLVHKSKASALLPELTRALNDQYGSNNEQSHDPSPSSGLGKLVAKSHVKRAVELLQEVEDRSENDKSIRILCGGSKSCNCEEGFVAPTFIVNPPMDCRLMKEEIFAPILPIIVVESRAQAVQFINSVPGTPLGLYVFTTRHDVFTDMTELCRSGTAVRNDSLIQFSSPSLPFGGLGTSGMGMYRGESSFQAFSHMLPSVYRPVFPGADLNNVRCHPLGDFKTWFIRNVGYKVPDIPVLKNARRAAILSMTAWLIVLFVLGNDAWSHSIQNALADVLVHMASVLG